MTPGTPDRTGALAIDRAAVFLATREHGLSMCLAIAERLGIPVERRILVAADTSTTAEAEPSFPAEQRARYLADFGMVVDWNALIWPQRAHGLDCVAGSMEARLLARAINPEPGTTTTLVIESIQVPPARALTAIFPSAELHVYADGLMTYGSRRLSPGLTRRIAAIHYRDLLPGLRPRLIDYEAAVDYQPYDLAEVEQYSRNRHAAGPLLTGPTAVVALQYLAGLGLVSADEEHRLAERMIAAAAADGCEHILVKDHPARPGLAAAAIARSRVAAATEFPGSAPLEPWLIGLPADQRARLSIYSCFSTALPAAVVLGVRAIAVGTDLLLTRIPRPNGNYVPVVICDSICQTVPFAGPLTTHSARAVSAPDGSLDLTLEALGFAAAPAAHWASRLDLAARLRTRPADQLAHLNRYLRRSVITSLGLDTAAAEPIALPRHRRASTDDRESRFALSMIVPGRNVEAFISSLEGSIRANSGDDVEWLLVDDGSEDGTPQEFARLAAQLPHVRTITQPQPSGPSAARNAGIAAAQGRFIGFMDADDWIAAGHLRRVIEDCSRHQVDLLRYSYVKVSEDLATVVRQPIEVLDVPVEPRDYILPLDQSTCIDLPQPWLSVCRRSFVLANHLTFDVALHTAEDREWTWRVFLAAEHMVVSSAIGYYWRRGTSTSLTQIGDERQLQFLRAYATVIDRLTGTPEAVFLPKVHRSLLMIGIGHLTRSHRLAPGLSRRTVLGLRRQIRRMSAEDLQLATVSIPVWRRRLITLMTRPVVFPLQVVMLARRHRPEED